MEKTFHIFAYSLENPLHFSLLERVNKCSFFKKRFYLFIFRESGGKEKGREAFMRARSIDWSPLVCHASKTQACILTGNPTGDLPPCGMTPNLLSHTVRAWIFFCINFQSVFKSWLKILLSSLSNPLVSLTPLA